MAIILENLSLPEKGLVEVKVNVSFEIKVTAEEARRKVNRWLIDNVSLQMGGDPPTLVVGQRAVWRVPTYITFPHTGRFGVVGAVEVDVETGELLNLMESKTEIIRRLEEEVKPRLPPYQPGARHVPPEYLAPMPSPANVEKE